MCVITAYGLPCLVAGCRGSGAGQQAVRPGREILRHRRSCNISLPGRSREIYAYDLSDFTKLWKSPRFRFLAIQLLYQLI